MTVSNTSSKQAPQAMDGIATAFSFTFEALPAVPEGIKVAILDTTTDTQTDLIYNDGGVDGYTVSVNANGVGGSVTVNDARTSDYTLTIYRVYDEDQTTNYADYNAFPSETVENNQDKLTFIAQQQSEVTNRSIVLPVTTTGVSTTLPTPAADEFIGWNSAGTALENKTDPTVAAAAAAAAAAASAAAAATSETNAATSEANASSSATTAATSASNAATSETNSGLNVGYAEEWANKAEDSLVSAAAGGDLVDDYSALHWAAKAAASAASNNLPTIQAGDAGKILEVNPGETGYQLTANTGAIVDDFTIENNGGVLELAPKLLTAIVANRMAVLALGDTSSGEYTDGVADTYTDQSGIDLGSSSGQVFEGGSYRTPVAVTENTEKLIMNFNYIDGTLEVFDSAERHVITQVGNATLKGNHYKFGNGSLELDGTSQYITVPDHADFDFGTTADFTFDLWFKQKEPRSGVADFFFSKADGFSSKEMYGATNNISRIIFSIRDGADSTAQSAQILDDNDWHHLVFARTSAGTVISVYLDGWEICNNTAAVNDVSSLSALFIGARHTAANWINGYIDDFRVSNNNRFGVASVPEPDDWWTLFDNGASTFVRDFGNNGNDGTASHNTDTLHASGKVKYAFDFDGSTNFVNTNTSVAGIASDNLGTFCAWVNTDVTGAPGDTIFSIGRAAAPGEYLQIGRLGGTGVFFAYLESGGTTQWQVNATTLYQTGVWYHIAVTHDGSVPKIYVDGVDETTNAVSTDLTYWLTDLTGLDTGRIGCGNYDGGGNTLFWDGRIEDVRYYSGTALTSTQINSIRDAGLAGIYGVGSPQITVPTAAAVDDANTMLLLPFDTTTIGNDFVDISTGGAGSPHTVTPFAGVNVTGKFGNAFARFPGGNDVFSVPDNVDFQFGSGDWTIEFWVTRDSIANVDDICGARLDVNNRWNIRLNAADVLTFNHLSGGVSEGSFQTTGALGMANGVWHHIAVVRNGASPLVFLNGVSQAVTINTALGTFTPVGADLNVGGVDPNNQELTGCLDDFRIVKGTAVYTVGFTPPSSALTAIANTVLLLSCDTQDESDSKHIPTFNGATGIKENFDKFGRGALQLNGTAVQDSLTIPTSTDFDIYGDTSTPYTIDCWAKKDGASIRVIITRREASADNWNIRVATETVQWSMREAGVNFINMSKNLVPIVTGQWHHYAVVIDKDGTYQRTGLFIDGEQVGFQRVSITQTLTAAPLIIGQSNESLSGGSDADFWEGEIDEVRIQNNNAFSITPKNFPIILQGEGTNGQTTDVNLGYSRVSSEPVFRNNAQLSNAITPKFNATTCFAFDGTGDHLEFSADGSYYLVETATEEMSVDFWVWFNAGDIGTTTDLCSKWQDANNFFALQKNSVEGIGFFLNFGGVTVLQLTSAAAAVTSGQWYHIALCRDSSSNYGIYIDGTQVAHTNDTSIGSPGGDFSIGSRNNASGAVNGLNGYIEQFRMIREENFFSAAPNGGLTDTITIPTGAVTAANTGAVTLTVPTAAHTSDANTKLLLHFDPPNDLLDSSASAHTVTPVNGASVTGAFGTASVAGRMVFDGVDDNIALPDHSDWDVVADVKQDYTIDFWVRHNDHTGIEVYMQHGWNGTVYDNAWRIRHRDAVGIEFIAETGGAAFVAIVAATAEITDTLWHHFALIKIGSEDSAGAEYGIYLDGQQSNYVQSAGIDSYTNDLTIGGVTGVSQWFDGEMDGIRIAKSNVLSGAPNIGDTDTITVPIAQPAVTPPVAGVMTLQSNNVTALASPDTIKIYFDLEDIDPTIVLNTDIIVRVRRNTGDSYKAATLTLGSGTAPRRIIEATVDMTTETAGTDVSYQVETFNDVQMRLHAVTLLWD
jgi:hypothetical protein